MSTITIYKTSRIIPSRNLKVDSIENYLATVPSLTFSDFQYIRPKLDGTIKINAGQEEALRSSYAYDYLKVVNGNGEKTQYYFITKVEQRSEETLELTLHMDAVNTFRDDYEISPNSIIHREFKDRYKKITTRETVTVRDTEEGFIDPTYYDWDQSHTVGITEVEVELRPFPNATLIKAVAYWDDESLEAFSLEITDQRDFIARYDNGHGRYVTGPDYVEYTFQYDKNDQALPIIDYLSEGITPQLYKTREDFIEQFADTSWNLIYRNENNIEASQFNQVNPVNVYLAPDTGMQVSYKPVGGRTKTPSDFASNRYTFIHSIYRYPINIRTKTQSDKVSYRAPVYDIGTAYVYDTYIFSDGSTITLYWYRFNKNTNRYRLMGTYRNIVELTFDTDLTDIPIQVLQALPTVRPADNPTGFLPLGDYATGIVSGVDEIGLDDARLMKVIKLPYPPTNGFVTEGGDVVFSGWEYSSAESLYKGSINGQPMSSEWTSELESPMSVLSVTISETDYNNKHLPWNKVYEPKMLHSDFHQPKFVYDSFTFLFELEKVDTDKWNMLGDTDKLKYKFFVTSTINSRFMFQFPDYVLSKSQSDYDNILPVNRNNEVTIYSNQYVNYLRTGYNYDVKNKERAKTEAGLGIAQSVLGAGGSVGHEIYHRNRMYEMQMPQQLAGVVGNIYGNVLSIIRAEEAMDKKKLSMMNQATSVSGSDDIDLLVAYSGNRAKMVYYEPSEIMSNALATLFHYCGYVSERRGTPNENTRYWFDFCQADIDFINERNAPTWALDEIRLRYSAGVTTLHTHNNEWDIEQQYENWENSLQ